MLVVNEKKKKYHHLSTVWHHFVDKRDSAFYANHYSMIIRYKRNTTQFCIQLYLQTHNQSLGWKLKIYFPEGPIY